MMRKYATDDAWTSARRLARRSGRLVQLMELDAPDIIIDNEIKLITTALAVMRGRPKHVLWMMRWRDLVWNFQAARDRRRFSRDGFTPEERLLRLLDDDK